MKREEKRKKKARKKKKKGRNMKRIKRNDPPSRVETRFNGEWIEKTIETMTVARRAEQKTRSRDERGLQGSTP